MTIRKIISRLISIPTFGFTLVLCVCLLLAKTCAWIEPKTWVIPQYLGLAFPIISICIIIVSIYWLLKKKWWVMLITISCLAVCYKEMVRTFSIGAIKEKVTHVEEVNNERLKVLTFNVRLFNFYDKESSILKFINSTDADIVCLQEFGYYTGNEKKFLTKKNIHNALCSNYPHCYVSKRDLKMSGVSGTAIYSKYPFINKGEIKLNEEEKSAIYADIKKYGHKVRIYNVHLESNKLSKKDKKRLENIFGSEEQDDASNVNEIKEKLSDACKRRARQADIIAEKIKDCETTSIVCGDFNDVPVSYTYNTIRGDRMKDAFVECGLGYGNTYHENALWFRIDHILHDENLRAIKYKRGGLKESDHYPVYAEFTWKE